MKFDVLIDFFLFAISVTVPIAGAECSRTCGDRTLRFPFGFSDACQIRLNCTSNGTILAADFPVQSVDGDTLSVSLPPACGRPVEAIRRLFTDNFAPTSQNNAILLKDCGSKHRAAAAASKCFIPQKMAQAHFDLLDCDGDGDGDRASSNISCYSETDNRTSFIDYGNLTRSGCRSLFSAISMQAFANSSAVSLEIQIVRLGWWLRGGCRCSENSRCVPVSPPVVGNQPAYRCECLRGFEGDGFRDGFGCRNESRTPCDPSTYFSGQCGGTTRFGVLIGGVAAGAFIMVTCGSIICLIRKRSRVRTTSRRCHQLSQTTGITVPIYPYTKMEKATDFFSDKRRLGHGAYGTVYAGKLSDQWVAIKRIKQADPTSISQAINEVKLLSSVSHPNLVRLLGCCMTNDEQILVYEFMPNGTLSQHLRRERGDGKIPWHLRLAIAVETARAISYLHNSIHPPIYHRDVKSSNILLDFEFRPKVADFGLSRLGLTESSSAHISTAPQGTPGYVDPQYHQHFQLSDRSDVYSFGVVLMEIITGMQAVDFARPPNEVNLAALAADRIGRGCLDEILDPVLEPDEDAWTLASVHKVAELAFRCLAFHSDMRPSMMEVAEELEQISVVEPVASRLSRLSSTSDHPRDNKALNEKGREFDSAALFGGTSSMDMDVVDSSPYSGEDTWHSDLSTPSSSSLLCQGVLPGKN